jgi:peptide/nickel transport system substrate-binding protein
VGKKAAWWEKLGKPQFGGEMVIRSKRDIVNFDPYFAERLTTIQSAWMERLHVDDWTLDPEVYDYRMHIRPNQFVKGHLAESWEFTEPGTYVVHLRKGIHWQDIPPVNGREFTADDVAFHYHRLFGLGSGLEPSPYHAKVVTAYRSLISVTAIDRYTVVFKWKVKNPEFILETLQANALVHCIEAREAVEKWGDVSDWHHAMGTGPFILQDFVPGESATLIKNPNYWGHDERYPRNKLPYIDKLKVLIIPDDADALSAMRAGKLDIIEGVSPAQAQAMQKTNPEILQLRTVSSVETIDPRNDTPPFNDIRVRKAMQMAVDLPAIAKTYYGGNADPNPSSLTSKYMTGWGWPYEEWPQELKDEYAYNPVAAKKLLADAGYPDGFKTNIVADKAGDLGLLQVVKSYFAEIGIDMEIRPMEPATWMSFVKSGHNHDQLAQRTGGGQLGLSHEPIRHLNGIMTGYPHNYMMIKDPVFDTFYSKAMAANSIENTKKIVNDANKYVAKQHFAISLCQTNTFNLYQPWLKGYTGQDGATSADTGGPQLLFFYPSRFWIDQELKKSMGH